MQIKFIASCISVGMQNIYKYICITLGCMFVISSAPHLENIKVQYICDPSADIN